MMESKELSTTKTDWLLIGLLILLVLPLRLWLLHNTEVTARDSIGYIRYALQFEHNSWAKVLQENHQHPGYPVLVWLTSVPIREIDGETTPENMELSTQLVSLCASLLMILPMYFLGKQFFDRKICFCGALLYQYLPISAQHLSDGISEPFYLVLLLSALLQAVHAIRERQLWRCALCGTFTGLAYLTRPEGLLILPAFGFVLILMQFRGDWRCSWNQFLACGTTMVMTTALVGSIYVIATGKITNKPAANKMIGAHAADGKEAPFLRQVTCTLFAASFSPTDQKVLRLQRSIWALIAEINQGFHYVASVPALLGLLWSVGDLRRRPGFWVLLTFALIHSFVLVSLAMSASYISDRHVMILVIGGSYFVAVGLWGFAHRAVDWCRIAAPDETAPALWKSWWRTAPGWSVILFLALIGLCLPKATQRLHGNRESNHRAGLWLAQHVKEGDVIVDDHSWSHFFAGLVFEEHRKPVLPADYQPTCFIVTTRSRDPEVDAQRQSIAKDAEIVYSWPENSLEKARVVVYAQPRNPKTHPWQKAPKS